MDYIFSKLRIIKLTKVHSLCGTSLSGTFYYNNIVNDTDAFKISKFIILGKKIKDKKTRKVCQTFRSYCFNLIYNVLLYHNICVLSMMQKKYL